jgi:hypothetical protein
MLLCRPLDSHVQPNSNCHGTGSNCLCLCLLVLAFDAADKWLLCLCHTAAAMLVSPSLLGEFLKCAIIV